jgi:DNA topoisomerase I
MATLVIVESPAKAGTVQNYLTSGAQKKEDYKVLSCFGHVRDLIPKKGAVEPDKDFTMHYEMIDRSKKHVDAIIKALKKADKLVLATDPDREGEAIAWHLLCLLQEKKVLKDKTVGRVVFHQITRKALQEALTKERDLAMDLVHAQQARRALDYLVGFNLSPLLWRKVRPGLSAGRVQSPALRLICERELEIRAFEPKEYWTVDGHWVGGQEKRYIAKLNQYEQEAVKQFTITNEAQATKITQAIKAAAQGSLLVDKVEKKPRKRQPAPPFMTSTLQQDAVRKLGLTTANTMRIAQQLYEGVTVGKEGKVGLITYMRTDSLTLADEAVTAMRDLIEEKYGKDYVPSKPRVYKSKEKNAQEAHEAIRPTIIARTPESLKNDLTPEQHKLYQLIWARALASQMSEALFDTVRIDFVAGKVARLHSTGSVLRFPGFLALYKQGQEESTNEDKDHILPDLDVGDMVPLRDVVGEQHHTEPPPRYSEANLIKALVEHGIGRPSTYSAIISTLLQREYVTKEQKRFHPTDVGMVVSQFLTDYFTRYVDFDFTANLEDSLDGVAQGKKEWKPLLHSFWGDFDKLIKEVESKVTRSQVTEEALDEQCPECNKGLVSKLGRKGRFIACTGYPECKFTRNIDGDVDEDGEGNKDEEVGRNCPDCEAPLIYKLGRFGKFIGCSGYPKCRHIESLQKKEPLGVGCPECKKHDIEVKRTRRGKPFYGCSGYPKCKYALWNKPINKPCPTCEWPLLTYKETKKDGAQWVCAQKECDYVAPAEPDKEAKSEK